MLYSKRKRKKLICRIIFFISLISLVPVIVHIFLIRQMIDIKIKSNICQAIRREENETIKYIFDLSYWRATLGRDGSLLKDNRTTWCDVPDDLRLLSKVISQIYDIRDHTRLPCQMIYSSSTTFEDFKCIRGGQMIRTNDNNRRQNQSYSQCKLGFALDLFIKKSENSSYPSLIADSYSPFSYDLYINVLHNQYRSCSSMWGFLFNFESISNYPWSSDSEKLKFFDITFGYDRSIYDFIPGPWLFNYVDKIKFTPKRLTLEQAMNSKQPIQSVTTSDVYWTNSSAKFTPLKRTMNNTSVVRAPILWMNSNCNTKSQRTQYMNKLMKYIDVDNYGTCGNNIRPLPEHIVQLQASANRDLSNRDSYNWEAGKLALTREYLFTIAIENSRNYDYITEKLWHPLLAGSVPIYLGAPNVEDWLPCQTNCIIDLRKFDSPKDAAMYIKTVARNKTLYQSYHQWRTEPVSQKFQNMLDYFTRTRDHRLECVLCDMSHRVGQGENAKEIRKEMMKAVGRF